MMKRLPITVVIFISVIALNKSAYANEQSFLETLDVVHQAASLTTEAATLNSNWSNVSNPNNSLKDNSVPLLQDRGCESLKPLDLLNNPDALFKECVKPTDNRSSQRVEPVEYFKVPRLDSGLSVTVTKF